MKIVVTGGSGRLGKVVVRDLRDKGFSAINLDRVRGEHGWTYILDLSDAAQVYDALASIRPDGVIHLAADPEPGGRPRHAQFANNVLSALAVLQASADFGVKQFVYASSEMASGWTRGHSPITHLPLTEEDTLVPINSYALGKRVGELLCESTAAAHPGMTIVSLRINYVVFEDDYSRLARATAHFPSGEYSHWAYVDGRDVAKATRLAIALERPGHHIYNVAAPDTFIDIPTIEAMERIQKPVRMRDSWPIFGSPMDCSKIQQELGWQADYLWRSQSALIEEDEPTS
jgi:nucleoside-diphosphate-sugar epimerase